MLRTWNRLVIVALAATGLAVASFAVLALDRPDSYADLVRPGLIVTVVAVLGVGYVARARPRFGVQD